jgi:hypothetical protein
MISAATPVNQYGSLTQQCLGKRWRLCTRKHARQIAKRIARETGTPMRVYRCVICTQWHVSRSPIPA